MPRNISDSVVVITGASSGIGRATALKLAEQRGMIVLASRQEDALQEVAKECERLGAKVLVVRTDVRDEQQVQNLARRAVESFGRIDAWINDAAVTMYARFEQSSSEAFRQVIETNLFGCTYGARAVLPYFRKHGRGVLINISSAFGKIGAPYVSAYTASKFAITGFSESLRMELRDAPDIHVCTILPATIDTPIFQHAANYTGRAVQALPPVYAPEKVSNAIIDCIRHPKPEVLVGRAARQIVALQKLSVSGAERIIAAKVEKQHFQDKPATDTPGNVFDPMPQWNRVTGGWRNGNHKARNGMVTTTAVLLAGAGVAAYYFGYRRRRPQPLLARVTRGFRPRRKAGLAGIFGA